MTTTNPAGSMRFSKGELMAGMLATLTGDAFTSDHASLDATFQKIGTEFPLMAPFAVGDAAVTEAIGALESAGAIELRDGKYHLTEKGRAHCVSSKRTLFNKGDIAQ